MTASGGESAPKNSLRGSTRGIGEWHVYTAIFDHSRFHPPSPSTTLQTGKTQP